MGQSGGFGLEVQIKVTATLTAFANMLDGEIPEFEKFLAEMTPHSATDGYAVWVDTGKRKLNEFKVTLGWDPADSTHAAMLAAFDATAPVDMAVVSPDGSSETIGFSAHIKKVGRLSPQEDGWKCEVTIQPTGAPTITP